MKKYINPKKEFWSEICKRPEITSKEVENLVDLIFKEVKEKGDAAVNKYAHFFDKSSRDDLLVSSSEIDKSKELVSQQLKEAIKTAKSNIESFHNSQLIKTRVIETSLGVTCWQESRPIEKVGLYIPGGSAPLFSTVLMLAIPARLAGCMEIVLCTPPDKNGEVNPAILYTAALCGIEKMYAVGGIQAIAAMTYGTESITAVYKLFGPGNQYVTQAKQKAQQLGVAMDMPAGPSEVMVIADESSNPAFVASDLLSQAEHGADSQVICVLNNEKLIPSIQSEIDNQIGRLNRKLIAAQALQNSGFVVLEELEEQIDFINQYAPEHLIINTKNDEAYLSKINSAGSVFIGAYTPESAGDYASGTNHTLPTAGFARAFSGLNMDAFMKKISFQQITKAGLEKLGPTIELMAEAEGLMAHKQAVSLRLADINVKV